MTVKMILAVDQGNSIGWADGTLPWKIAPDMDRFKLLTTGHDVFMGHSTFASLRRPKGLPNRRNIVLSRGTPIPDIETVSSLDFIREHQAADPTRVLWVMGGAQVYAQVIQEKLADEIYVTLAHTLSGGDVRLPFELYDWRYFMQVELAHGVEWKQVEIKKPGTPLGCPSITFLTLRKTK